LKNFKTINCCAILLWCVSRVKGVDYCRLGWAVRSLAQSGKLVLQLKIYIITIIKQLINKQNNSINKPSVTYRLLISK